MGIGIIWLLLLLVVVVVVAVVACSSLYSELASSMRVLSLLSELNESITEAAEKGMQAELLLLVVNGDVSILDPLEPSGSSRIPILFRNSVLRMASAKLGVSSYGFQSDPGRSRNESLLIFTGKLDTPLKVRP